MFKKYRDYLNDNSNGYWFKAKLYGWGWTPATWHGWLVSLVFLGLIILNALRFSASNPAKNDVPVNFLLETFGLVAILLVICWKKGEKPKWQWGPPKK